MDQPATYRSYAADEVVTGEGVAVEVPVASVGLRIASGLIDALVLGVLAVVLSIVLALLPLGDSEAIEAIIAILMYVGLFVAIPTVLETATKGRSLGKLALGLRTVRDDGGPITFRHALTRALVGTVEIYSFLLGGPAIVTAVIHPRAKRLGDLAAGTYVISQRAKLRLLPPPAMPPSLAHWAAGADIAPLPAGLAIGIRQFLGRAHTLTPMSRTFLVRDLYAATTRLVSPQPPPGHHPELVLAAVIAERRERDVVRLAAQEAQRARLLPAEPGL